MKKTFLTIMLSLVFLVTVSNAFAVGFGAETDETVFGTFLWEILNGSDGDDIMYGRAGWDIIKGHEGNDILYGGTGLDSLYGGEGNDILVGGDDYDRCYGDFGYSLSESCEYNSNVDTVIAHNNLDIVSNGSIILFPVDITLPDDIFAEPSDVVEVFVSDKDKALSLVLVALSFEKMKELFLDQAIERESGLYKIQLSALSAEDARNISESLFVESDDDIKMVNPMNGYNMTLKNVDYVGFRNTPLIPVQ